MYCLCSWNHRPFCRDPSVWVSSPWKFSHPSSYCLKMTLLLPIFFRKLGRTFAVEEEDHCVGRNTSCLMRSEHGTQIPLQELPWCSCTPWVCNLQLFVKAHDLWKAAGYALTPQCSLAVLRGSLTWRMGMTLMASQEKLPSILWYIVQRLQCTGLGTRTKSGSWPAGIAMYLKPTFKESYYTGVRADQIWR